ncbi:MAG: methyltransferase domain-containing protein [bacterium]|nr:methyltransferase domain-containing protein [bacterium]
MGSGTRQAELWGPSAKLWAEKLEEAGLQLSEWLIDRVYSGNGAHILDAGCGSGGALAIAAARGATVTGTDVAQEMLEICKQRIPNGNFQVADTESLPFADHSFDGVMAQNSLQFTESPVRALQELARVAKPDAKIGIVCFGDTAHSDFATVGAAVRKLFTTPPTFEGPFSLSPPTKLHKAISDAGLSVLEMEDIEVSRTYESFEDFWYSQSGTGATRFSVRELGEDLVKSTMAAALIQFTNADNNITLTNRFHAVIARGNG